MIETTSTLRGKIKALPTYGVFEQGGNMIDTVSRESVMELIRPSEISGNEGDIYEHPNALYKYARVAGFAMKNTIEDLKTRNVLQEKEFLIQRL